MSKEHVSANSRNAIRALIFLKGNLRLTKDCQSQIREIAGKYDSLLSVGTKEFDTFIGEVMEAVSPNPRLARSPRAQGLSVR